MKTKNYKTLNGFYRYSGITQICVCDLLNNEFFANGEPFRVKFSDEAIGQLASIIAGIFPKSKKGSVYGHVIAGGKDTLKFLQCFYLAKHKGRFVISNALSGYAYDFAIREFYKYIN